MKKYMDWLVLTCKWATKGMNGDEFKLWQDLTTELGKQCDQCQEGYICLSCHDTGLKLTHQEQLIITNIETAIRKKRIALHSEISMVN